MREVLEKKREEVKDVSLYRWRVAESIIYYFTKPGFPEDVYIALKHSILCAVGDVLLASVDMESPVDFIPLARIDRLVKHLPSREEFDRFFKENYDVDDTSLLSVNEQRKFWDFFDWEFVDEIDGIKIHWK